MDDQYISEYICSRCRNIWWQSSPRLFQRIVTWSKLFHQYLNRENWLIILLEIHLWIIQLCGLKSRSENQSSTSHKLNEYSSKIKDVVWVIIPIFFIWRYSMNDYELDFLLFALLPIQVIQFVLICTLM